MLEEFTAVAVDGDESIEVKSNDPECVDLQSYMAFPLVLQQDGFGNTWVLGGSSRMLAIEKSKENGKIFSMDARKHLTIHESWTLVGLLLIHTKLT